MAKKKEIKKTDDFLATLFRRSMNLGFMPNNAYTHATYMMVSDVAEMEDKEILSKDTMLGNIEDPEMISYLMDDKDMLSSWCAMAEEEPMLKPFYKSLTKSWLAEFRITRSSGGFERSAQGSPNGDFFGAHPQGYEMPQNQPEQQKSGGMFDFLKGKKLLGGNAPNPAEQGIRKGGW